MNDQHNENGPTSRGNDNAGPGTNHLDQRRGPVPVSDSIHTTTDITFDPGDGWRRLATDEVLEFGAEVINYSRGDGIRAWVREEPVPALPTRSYVVIRVEWKRGARAGATDELAFFGGDWIDVDGIAYSPAGLRSSITGFEVLSEPRVVTARAVLKSVGDRIATHVKPGFELMPDGSEDPESAGYVAGLGTAVALVHAAIRALEADV